MGILGHEILGNLGLDATSVNRVLERGLRRVPDTLCESLKVGELPSLVEAILLGLDPRVDGGIREIGVRARSPAHSQVARSGGIGLGLGLETGDHVGWRAVGLGLRDPFL